MSHKRQFSVVNQTILQRIFRPQKKFQHSLKEVKEAEILHGDFLFMRSFKEEPRSISYSPIGVLKLYVRQS